MKKWGVLLLVIVVSCLTYYLFTSNAKKSQPARLFCGAENIFIVDGDTAFANNESLFWGGIQSNEEVLAGKYAVKAPTLFYSVLSNDYKVEPGNYIQSSIWKKGGGEKAFLIITDNNNSIHVTSTTVDSSLSNGWQKLSLNFLVPPNFSKKTITIEGFNSDTSLVYFDNLSIAIVDTVSFPSYSNEWKLQLPNHSLKSLHRELKNLYTAGIKSQPTHLRYNCTLQMSQKSISGYLSLNSNTSADFNKGKWNLKFEYKEGKQDKTILFQDPQKNNFLHEWWVQNWMKQEHITDNSLSFTPLSLNGTSLGVYQVKEKTKSPTQIILNWDLEGFWNLRSIEQYQQFFFESFNLVMSKDTSFNNQKNALTCAYNFISHKRPLTDIADTASLAKYFAITNIATTLYGFTVPNYEFVYNINDKKIRVNPINLFNKTTFFPLKFDSSNAIYGNLEYRHYHETNVDYIFSACMNNPSFIALYIHYLDYYSSPDFINSFKEKYKAQAKSYQTILEQEYLLTESFWDFAKEKALIVHKTVDGYRSKLKHKQLPTFIPYTPSYHSPCEKITYIDQLSVKVYKEINKKSTYYIQNYYCSDVQLIGWGNETKMIQERKEPLLVKPIWEEEKRTSLVVEPDFDYAYLKVKGEDKFRKVKIHLYTN